MRVAIDTNILVYAEGFADSEADQHKPALARRALAALPAGAITIPVQCLGELFRVLVSKKRLSATDARDRVPQYRDLGRAAPTSDVVLVRATDLVVDHQLQFWDAIILAAASEHGCRMLLSEDYQDGFTWGGVTVVNPFAVTLHPLLTGLSG
ncbi:PIN domain-containing protein [Niveispirillum sp. KHB5.9]|uniref:PIN domain-containing protein n=1 Tax=Niveispirillum sp. KHB5.9 TaxID=3400269 RepID=UPI003A8B9D7D